MTIKKALFGGLLLCSLTGCFTKVTPRIEPKIDFCVQAEALEAKPAPFKPLDSNETMTRWGAEYQVGQGFGRELDLYQTITAMRRAKILMRDKSPTRSEQADYYIMLSYYLGKRYGDVVESFCRSPLKYSDPHTFAPYNDMLVILYDSYMHLSPPDPERADNVLACMKATAPELAARIELSHALSTGKLSELQTYRCAHLEDHSMESLLDNYCQCRKSVGKAQLFNALLPGAGYWYVGQRQTAITAFLLNALFIGAAAHFFVKGENAAGIIFTSFEAGWYFGGVLGAGLAAKSYNERMYEKLATCYMQEEHLFPVLQLQYSF